MWQDRLAAAASRARVPGNEHAGPARAPGNGPGAISAPAPGAQVGERVVHPELALLAAGHDVEDRAARGGEPVDRRVDEPDIGPAAGLRCPSMSAIAPASSGEARLVPPYRGWL